jgi:hypothetical protein
VLHCSTSTCSETAGDDPRPGDRSPGWRRSLGLDRLESVLTKLYLDGGGPEWEAIWGRVCTVLERATGTAIDRCQAVAVVLQGVIG